MARAMSSTSWSQVPAPDSPTSGPAIRCRHAPPGPCRQEGGISDSGPLTYRLLKLEGLESQCEDDGQAVVYRGTLPQQPHRFALDKHHDIEGRRIFPVCGNSWRPSTTPASVPRP
jgi:hypothetical protein